MLDNPSVIIFASISGLLILTKLILMLRAEYKTDKIVDDIEESYPDSNFDVNCDTVKIENAFGKVTFFSSDHKIGSCSQNIQIGNKEYKITDRDYSKILSDSGEIVATSKENLEQKYIVSISFGLKGFLLKSLNYGDYPYGVYRDEKGIGIIRLDEMVFPRDIPVEVQIFSYKVAFELYNEMKRKSAT